jgi:protein ImuB
MSNYGDKFGKDNAIRSLKRDTNCQPNIPGKPPAPAKAIGNEPTSNATTDNVNQGIEKNSLRNSLLTAGASIAHSPAEHSKRILCLWFPNWPIQRLVVSQPELRRQRIVLFRRDSRRGQLVSAVSPLAMQDGVCIDMPLSEAKSLLRGSGKFHLFEHDITADLEALEELADSMESFSPIVGLEVIDETDWKRGTRPASILLEITGLAHLFGDENQLARKTILHCDDQGYLPRIAVGDTIGLAWGAARYFAGQYFRQHQEPLVLPVGGEEAIKQLPVDALRLPATIIDTLHQLGLQTIGQLMRLSRNDLAMRFGNTIHRRIDQMTGVAEEPVVARRKPAEFSAQQLLEFPTHHRETIEVIIARLITKLCIQMRTRQRGALEWSIQLVCQTGPPIEFRVNLFQPTATTRHVMPLVEMQVEQALSPHTRKSRRKKRKPTRAQTQTPPNDSSPFEKDINPEQFKETQQPTPLPCSTSPPEISLVTDTQYIRYTTVQVQEISVSVTSDVLLIQQQRQLFDENPRLDQQALAHLINRLASRLGTPNVVYPSLQSGAQPEYAYRLKPLVDPTRKQRRRKTKPPKLSHKLARPLRLFQPARKIEVVGLFSSNQMFSNTTPSSNMSNNTDSFSKSDSFNNTAPSSNMSNNAGPSRNTTPSSNMSNNAGSFSNTDSSNNTVLPSIPTLPTANFDQAMARSQKKGSLLKNINMDEAKTGETTSTDPDLGSSPSQSLVIQSLLYQGKQQKVTRLWGPERIETGWWRGRTICRDYWRVEIETNQHYWVYRDLRSANWFLHGEF